MQLPDLTPDSLPEHPNDTLEDWPLDTEQRPIMRFDWNQSHKDAENFQNIRKICDWVKEKGSQHIPESAASVRAISMGDLQDRVVKKFKLLVSARKKNIKKQAALPNSEDVPEQSEQPKQEAVDVKPQIQTASKSQSRRKGVRFILIAEYED